MLNGITKVVMTKADVLDSFKELNVCTGYEINGKITQEIPFEINRTIITPEYKLFNGWNTDTTAIKNATNLPNEMSVYINFINQFIGAPIKYVSNGPAREQIISL